MLLVRKFSHGCQCELKGFVVSWLRRFILTYFSLASNIRDKDILVHIMFWGHRSWRSGRLTLFYRYELFSLHFVFLYLDNLLSSSPPMYLSASFLYFLTSLLPRILTSPSFCFLASFLLRLFTSPSFHFSVFSLLRCASWYLLFYTFTNSLFHSFIHRCHMIHLLYFLIASILLSYF